MLCTLISWALCASAGGAEPPTDISRMRIVDALDSTQRTEFIYSQPRLANNPPAVFNINNVGR